MPRLTEREIELLLAQHYVTVCASIAAQRTASAPQDVAADIPHILKAQHAMHDRASNDPDAAQACWQFAHATGTAALGLVDVVDLIRWNTQGRAAAKHLPVDRRMRVDFQLAANLGYLYARTGDLQRAAEHYNVARYFATQLHEHARLGEIAGHLGEVLIEMNQFDAARTYLKSSNDLAATASSRTRAVAAFRLGRLARLQHQHGDAAAWLDAASQIAQDAGLSDFSPQIVSEQATLLLQSKDFNGAIRLYEDTLARPDIVRDENLQGQLIAAMADAYLHARDYAKARGLYGKALAIFGRTKDRLSDGRTHAGIGVVLAHQGAWEEAFGYLKRSLELARECGDQEGEAKATNNISTFCKQLPAAERLLHQQATFLLSASA